MVLPSFVSAALAGKPITVYGDGSQQRVFGHVLDAVDAVMKLFFNDKAIGHAFNIGGEGEVSIKQLAEMVIAETGSSSKIEMIPYKDAYPAGFEDMMRRIPDTTKLRQFTGWSPKYSLKAIISDVASSMKA
jgi:UDP-glucose 4-epimerase